jgi:hypothetical protein
MKEAVTQSALEVAEKHGGRLINDEKNSARKFGDGGTV